MPDKEQEALRPAAGGINCALAEHVLSEFVDIQSKGDARRYVQERLSCELGRAIMQIIASEKPGTFEIQLTRLEEKLPGLVTKFLWRVDVWKARQRQYLTLKVRNFTPLELHDKISLTAPGYHEVYCSHCGERHAYPTTVLGDLPRKTAMNCACCKLPIWLHLVEDK